MIVDQMFSEYFPFISETKEYPIIQDLLKKG